MHTNQHEAKSNYFFAKFFRIILLTPSDQTIGHSGGGGNWIGVYSVVLLYC